MQFTIVGLQRKRLLESLKSKGGFFFPEEKEGTLVCLYRQVENRAARFPDTKKRLDLTETGDPCLLSEMGFQLQFQPHHRHPLGSRMWGSSAEFRGTSTVERAGEVLPGLPIQP